MMQILNFKNNKGKMIAVVAAIISGVSIFLMGFAGKAVKDPYVLTTSRNIMVAIFLTSLLVGISRWVSIKKLSRSDWLKIVLIGLIGGSIPFLLFFKGLSLSGTASGAFVNKTLFIWVGLMSAVFFKEKFSLWQGLAMILLLCGSVFLQMTGAWRLGYGEILVFCATLLWAVETILVKKFLKSIPTMIMAWGRMFFGSIIMLIYLSVTHRIGVFSDFDMNQWLWIAGPSILLFLYVITWYGALKYEVASVVTSILVLALPVTIILNSIFVKHSFSLKTILGFVLVTVGVLIYLRGVKESDRVKKWEFTFR